MRRGSIVQLLVIGVVLGGIAAAVAIFVPWLPTPASREAGRIDFVIWFTTIICIAVFALVGAVMIYSVLKFRVPDDDDLDGPPIHGHTGLEIVWTAVPAALVTAISIVSGVVLAKNDHLPAKHLTVQVSAVQFAWSFTYPGYKNLTTGTLRLPLHEPVDLVITSKDVLHSFWVPDFGQKQDAVPGSINHLKVTPTRIGTYPVICTELCGLGHAIMRTSAIVMSPGRFKAWVAEQQKALAGPPGAAGKAVYDNNGCGACHTLTAAGSKGTVGPDLDKLPASAEEAGKPLEDFVRESIVDPAAYIAPGYPANVMPGTFAGLPKDQIDALVQYLVSSSKGG